MNLPHLTWEQAQARHLWPASAFLPLGITAGAIRKRASRGPLRPVAIGPRGCRLYRYHDVVGHADGGVASPDAPRSVTLGRR